MVQRSRHGNDGKLSSKAPSHHDHVSHPHTIVIC
jgi:hypothetical protein